MSIWKYVGAGLGSLPGIVTLNPALAVAGASAGYGIGSGVDAANESSDAASQAQAAANGVTAPTISPNAGVGSGWGGLTQGEQGTVSSIDAQEAAMDKDLNDYKVQYQAAWDALQKAKQTGNQAAIRAAEANWQTVQNDPRAGADYANQYNAKRKALEAQRPDMSDTARFSAQAQDSYNRQAPQVQMVTPNMGLYGQDRSMFSASGQGLSSQLNRLRTNPVATGQGQQALVDRLNSDLAGNAPSLAQAQLSQTTAQNIANQRSMMATAGPQDYAAAERAAIMGGANAQQQAVQQAAILRAQEYTNSENTLGTTLNQQRGETLQNFQLQNEAMISKRAQELQAMGLDAQTATNQAQLEAQQRLNNANLQAGQNQLNQGREMGYLGAYQDTRHMQQNNQQFNATSNLEAQRIKAGLTGTAVNASMQDAASQRQMAGNYINAGASFYNTYSMMNKNAPSSPSTNSYYDNGSSGSHAKFDSQTTDPDLGY